ncbi:MAG: terpene synthase family protein [Methylococcales bacterium]
MNHAELFATGYQYPTSDFTIPKPDCPFPVKLNKYFTRAHEHTIAWVGKFGLVAPGSPQARRFPEAEFARLAALTHPEIDVEDLKLATDWHSWLFVHDDVCDDSNIGRHASKQQAMDRPLLALLRGEANPDPEFPLSAALGDILQRIIARTEPRWVQRFVTHVEQYLSSNVWEARNRQKGVPPALDDYMTMRRYTGAVLSCFDLILMVEDLAPEGCSWVGDRLVGELETKANHHICWINDLFGLRKEIREKNVNNLVLVLQYRDGCDLQTAVSLAIDLCNEEIRSFADLVEKQAVSSTDSPTTETKALARYIEGMKSWMSGHIAWYQHTGRYLPRAS